jgi:hypothetical protein
MTKEEWISEDKSFYHITQTSNISLILKNGLKSGNIKGICVIRSRNELILEYLCQMMLFTTDETNFSVIEIKPSKHSLSPSQIGKDQVVEITNPLHNYILLKYLKIDEEDVIHNFEIDPIGFQDKILFEENLIGLNLIEELQ